MLSVILPRWDEPTVIALTKDNLTNELRSLPDSELIIADSWDEGIKKARCDFICAVEPDCLVSSGYFSSNLNLFKKNSQFRKLAMVSSAVGLNNWGNKIYGYHLEQVHYRKDNLQTSQWEVQPFREKRSSSLFPVQVGMFAGAIVRRSAIDSIMKKVKHFDPNDLVKLSADISFYLWGSGRRVHVNPNTTYVSADRQLENPAAFKWEANDEARGLFAQELI